MEMTYYSAITYISAILFGLFGLGLLFLARKVEQWPRGLFVSMLVLATISASIKLWSGIHFHYSMSNSPPLVRVLCILEILVTPLPHGLCLAYFFYYCGEDYRKSILFRLQCGCILSLIVLELIFFFRGDYPLPPGQELPNPKVFALLMCLVLVVLFINVLSLVTRRKKLTLAQKAIFFLCFVMSNSIQLILMELLLIGDLVRRYELQKEETIRQRTLLAVSQMRPHFIHNTLMSIYYLCEKDPQKAQQVIRNFSRYLQSNFMAIAQENPIPFAKELEHIKAYLAVEAARFENQLIVSFDTQTTFFRLPALTIQPLIENAIKHGLDPELVPLHVSLSTKDTQQGVIITVEDTGPGFPSPEEGDPHITLDNIRQRLSCMSSGSLTIEPREGGGTKVTVFIPWKKKEKRSYPRLTI